MTVSATHRRRGLLSRMMAADLDAARERADALATLIAAEYRIYGRFGFGPATSVTEWTVQVPRAALGPFEPPAAGRVDLADMDEVRRLGPELYERFRRTLPGVIDRPERWWQLATGAVRHPGHPFTEPFAVLYRDGATGRVDGLLAYTADDTWEAKLPDVRLTVLDLVAVSDEATRALWRHALSVDWVTSVRTGFRAPDDILPQLLGDPRAARTTTSADFMWLRLLDVPAALSARTYAVPASLVLDVPGEGRFALDGTGEGAECRPTTRSADLTLDRSDLASLYLGDETAVRLRMLGRIDEHTPGAVDAADAAFRTARRPWCPDYF